ncbi:MAG: Ig-like domain-containing protein, partial [Bacteroidales bacterium]|nr:Ig-like domain-containing protein [Bacteroidales bacterium]
IKEMIQLDYNNEIELIKFVEKSGYFSKPLIVYKEAFENSRPNVIGLDNIQNKSTNVSTNMDVLTINFSQEMDIRFRNFQLGSLGEESVIRFKDFRGFSNDGKSVSFGIEKLKPLKKYQIVVGSGFRNIDGFPLIPYLIEFETVDK